LRYFTREGHDPEKGAVRNGIFFKIALKTGQHPPITMISGGPRTA
jgi:hypothetical protein